MGIYSAADEVLFLAQLEIVCFAGFAGGVVGAYGY